MEGGVADFENVHTEYLCAGGAIPNDNELKSGLLRILPRDVPELLLRHPTNLRITFAQSRDTVVARAAQVLLERGGNHPLQAIDEPQRQRERSFNSENDEDALMRLLAKYCRRSQVSELWQTTSRTSIPAPRSIPCGQTVLDVWEERSQFIRVSRAEADPSNHGCLRASGRAPITSFVAMWIREASRRSGKAPSPCGSSSRRSILFGMTSEISTLSWTTPTTTPSRRLRHISVRTRTFRLIPAQFRKSR